MISALEQRRRTTTDLVFTREYTRGDGPPKLIRQIDKRDFARACRATGMVDFHWHDLRHTWASWHVQHGTPLMVLKELGGWETIAMVQKYAHLAPSHLCGEVLDLTPPESARESRSNARSTRR
ncbi:tyrosine-type recombinase/integrase [Burkholderia pseudomallei]|uniref:tyrosine-type recombinase/integrase n=1 Tax=Burkholderia TaxID=32008 RepID=UPI0005727990|nr:MULTISPECIES: tyrosine-type recombinase/integrase [Burkholderia]ANW48805.1 integrase [Burkholderia pseudomallei]ANW54846.1 integrase [Burkholderia pseudomallei]MCS6596589.1 tyrosine-type recombinase/integrase [Burkholderia pseudomallei]MCT7345703.1 tyrosine-type recombinase/integrase [Burkholderia pseudomallei]MCT7916963.1 tyrosine-type recombinase/integrase [Burkholderia pseudomallei]